MPFISAGDGDLKSTFITDAWLIDQFVGNRLWAWGRNYPGPLGDNTQTNRSNPVQTIAGLTNWTQVAGGGRHTAAIKNDGTLWLWGDNLTGSCGTNLLNFDFFISSPVQTITTGTNWNQVSCGYHTAAIKTDGSLWLWGNNTYGGLGDNTTTDRSSPIQSITAGNNWKQVSCGFYTSAAIKTDGTLWLWGYNYQGSLGNNSTANTSSPVQTIAGGSNWKQISKGHLHTAGIKTDGTLWLWGWNYFGQLGDNTIQHRSSPVQTVSGGTNWKQVACAGQHTVAIKTDSSLWTWGRNSYGQLGTNTSFDDKSSPVQTIAVGNNWKQVFCGGDHTAAIKTDGSIWLWGQNTFGKLGDNTTTNRSSPVQTTLRGNNWKQVSCGRNYTLAVTYGD